MEPGPAEAHDESHWPRLLSLSAHELRSPLTVVAGYIRMLLQDRAGPVTDQQRRLLAEAEKSCGRLSHLVGELSVLSQLESGTAPFNRSTVDLTGILTDVASAQPELPDRSVTVSVIAEKSHAIHGDPVQLATAFAAILNALRRELVTGDQIVVRVDTRNDDGPFLHISIGEPDRIEALRRLDRSEMTTFDEWRGGSGLSLPTARRIIDAHGGRVWSPSDAGQSKSKATAIIVLPALG